MPIIREFSEDDYQAVADVWRQAGLTLKPSDTLPELRKLIERNPGLFLVAEEEGTIIGAVIGAWDGRRAWIYHLAVLPAAQGRGTGRLLMAEVERRLHAAGATKINLLVERGNAGVAEQREGPLRNDSPAGTNLERTDVVRAGTLRFGRAPR